MAARKTLIEQVNSNAARPAPIVLISGAEQFLADRAIGTIRTALRTATPDLEAHEIDAPGYARGELLTLASPSLFAEPRIIVITGAEKSSDAFIEDAKQYLAQPAEAVTVVIRHAGGQRGKGLLDAIRGESGASIGAIEVVCAEIKKDTDRMGFAQAEFQRLHAQATPAAMRMLVSAFGNSLGELAGAISQLVEDRPEAARSRLIDEDDVDRATEGRVEAGAFKVADAATAGNTAAALTLLRQALSTGTDPIPLLAALNMKVRAMGRVFRAPGSSAQLAKAFGMAPWQVERAQRESRNWRESDLALAIDLAAETEWQLKGGSRDPGYALERYVLFVSQRGRGA